MDSLSCVEDEVALEGLDGITLPTLWIRLENRKPEFPLKLDNSTKEFIWRSLVNNTELKFYQLPREREDLELLDRFKSTDPETANEFEQEFPEQYKDIYPVHVIPENKYGVQGSCEFFKERKDVTKHIRHKSLIPLVNMEEAMKKYGRKLVVVASQWLRKKTLIGPGKDPDLNLTSDSYCVLERVGRSRWRGELQTDLHGGAFKVDARKFHYLRKSLVKYELVTMQSFVRQIKDKPQQHTILLHLNRFHVSRRSLFDKVLEYASIFLQEQPNKFTTMMAFKEDILTATSLNESIFGRFVKHMRSSKLIDVEFFMYPVEKLDPSAGPCKNKNGSQALVRCVKLLKPYSKKALLEDDDEDDDEENSVSVKSALHLKGRIMEKDLVSQAYHTIMSCGSKGISQRSLALQMNIYKRESRTICRKLEKAGFIKGVMEDEGRQRTTKFFSHKRIGVSDQLQLYTKEQERSKLLSTASSQVPIPNLSTSETVSSSDLLPDENDKQNTTNDNQTEQPMCDVNEAAVKTNGKKKRRRRDICNAQASPAASETSTHSESGISGPAKDQAQDTEEQPNSSSGSPLPQNEAENSASNIVVVDSPLQPQQKSHETYRLLKRKNLIVEAVQTSKIIEGFPQLLKIITDEEKQDGLSHRCCKKSLLRLVQSLSREGLLRLYTTTVIQDGVKRPVNLIVHPSILPNDERVVQLIDQVRFRISSSYSTLRPSEIEEKPKETEVSKSLELFMDGESEDDKDFNPTRVLGLGKSYGFQPKMYRLRVVHNFLWHLIYGHPLRSNSTCINSASETATDPDSAKPEAQISERQTNEDQKEERSDALNPDVALGDEEELNDKSQPDSSKYPMKVYIDEDSWKRFVPPVRLQNSACGWAMTGDILLCLPLSVFMQVVQINYKVDGLEEYLSDPLRQHYLVRVLPAKMKRQLLYKRKYVHVFHEALQRLTYMGLVQFGVMEKFKDKDQVTIYLKCNATIVDTTNAEPHYWLVTESPDNPFERRQYTFNSAEDVEDYWFDMMCVCLNTPLGVIRNKRKTTENEDNPEIPDSEVPSFVYERHVFTRLAYLLSGSQEVVDDGSIPGDGKGAAGLDSEFFAHLKRNWLWTSHLLACKTKQKDSDESQVQIRLKNLLGKNTLKMALEAGRSLSPRYLTIKKTVVEESVEVGTEPASRNQQVVGGKGQKRKRSKKEAVPPTPKKRRVAKKRNAAHDEADHRALKRMTRMRVCWSLQEDAIILLGAVTSNLLNAKLGRPFVAHCILRDLLHSECAKSLDKTSLAVGRRTRYILKHPLTLRNYKICLAEVHQDKALMRALEEKKPANPESPEDCNKAYSEYISILRQKFVSILKAGEISLPDSKRDFFSKFTVTTLNDGKTFSFKDELSCTKDIHAIVLHNLIQSTLAMTNSLMKSSRSFQTFYMYSKYDQELLCQVFIQCRKCHLVNRRRIHRTFGPKKNRSLPILPMSFQLSQAYYRRFSWRFIPSLCTDSFCFLRNLITSTTRDDRPRVTFHHEPEFRTQSIEETPQSKAEPARKAKQHEQTKDSESADASSSKAQPSEVLANLSDSGMLRLGSDVSGGACLVSLSLMTLGLLNVHLSIPKRIVVVDSNLVENDAVKCMAALEEDDDEENDDDAESERKKKLSVTSHQASHTNYLMMRGHSFPGIVAMRGLKTKDNIVLEPCLTSMQLRNSPAHRLFTEENLPPMDLTKWGPSLLPTRMTSFIQTPASSPPSSEECDRLLTEQRGYTTQDIEICTQLRKILDEAGEKGLDEEDLFSTHKHLLEAESGRTLSLPQYLKDLEENIQVVRVGGQGVRWVLLQHAEPWLLTINCKKSSWAQSACEKTLSLKSQHKIPFIRKRCSRDVQHEAGRPPAKKAARGQGLNKKSLSSDSETAEEKQKEGNAANVEDEKGTAEAEEQTSKKRELRSRRSCVDDKKKSPTNASEHEENASFISRPWRLVDGKLNRSVCKGILEALLFHVMSRPGLTQEALVVHYKEVLQPVAVLDLIQILIEMGCITKKTLVKDPKPSLFARPVHQERKKETRVEQPDEVFYEPTISCCLRLCRVLPKERHWNECANFQH